MKKYRIDDLMVPLSEYATVTVGATLHEAILALEKAQAGVRSDQVPASSHPRVG